ncbi:thioredoxin [Bradyrhizobium sp. CCBAU 53421]|uniref:thioredoxin n=1 Tax=Bradyrhizobium sp. CCBAU 53421 TaxID=1325120 RepID=UPI00188A0A38|nr:thioredoxin [Bradyrhizobium sp. CCBAU 53421]QOZ36942.1 thioredoxin [Bradyrhizobium sp. CCBAU 53421]
MNVKLQDGILIFAKRECETCQMVEHVIGQIADKIPTVVYTQDDPSFPSTVSALDDSSLESSFAFDVEAVPTVVRMREGKEVARTFGWSRADWEKLTGLEGLGEGLPEMRPGCGSKSREPGVYDVLRAKYGKLDFKSRQIRLGEWDDEIEACFDRGWSDGLPVVPPTDVRILRMLEGTSRKPDEIIGAVPPNLSPITVEKVAVNAVMAGCRPEYMPVVLTALEAALDPLFTMHGLLCTTCFSSPIIVVNGPVAREIGMNSGINCLGQGNRANATIGRALQLIIRNVGGGRPGELDRAVLGGPGKYTFCFAEDESDPTWMPLSVARGIEPGKNAVTLFQGDGIQGFIDQRSRTPEQLTKSLAMSLLAVGHHKLCEFTNALLVLVPEHYAIFREAGWDRGRITEELHTAMVRPGKDVIQGAHGVGEGVDPRRADEMVNKFWPEGLLIVQAGGQAGLFSAICAGWTGGRFRNESKPVTMEITT